MSTYIMADDVIVRHPDSAMHNDYIFMTLPLFAISTFFYGLRPVLLGLVAVLIADLCDRIICSIRKIPHDKTESSSRAFALIVTLLLPASISYYILIVAVVSTVLIGKAAFGGYGLYIFSPPSVGFAVVTISWPEQIFSYPTPLEMLPLGLIYDTTLNDGALVALKSGGLPNINLLNLLLGNYPASMGAAYAVAILACFAYLWMRKHITLELPLSYLATCVFIAFTFPRLGGIGLAFPWQHVTLRLQATLYELFTGMIFFAAVFLINDRVTGPKGKSAKIVYGIMLGIFTMIFRYYGSYNMATCFAIICVNVLSAPLDRWMSSFSNYYTKKVTTNKRDKKAVKKA